MFTVSRQRNLGSTWAKLAVATCTLALGICALAPVASAEFSFGSEGSGAGQINRPQGIAVDRSNGTVYVADELNRRVDAFDSSGNFLRAFGWGVADGTSTELQVCTTTCFKGLAGGGAGQISSRSGDLGAIAVDNDPASPSYHDVYIVDGFRIEKFAPNGEFLVAWGGGVITGGAAGTGDLSAGSTTVSKVVMTKKSFLVSQTISGAGIPAGTKIAAVGVGTITLSQPAIATGEAVALSVAEGPGNVSVNEVDELRLAPSNDLSELEFVLGVERPATSFAETSTLKGSLTAAELQAALAALPNVGAGNVEVSGPFKVKEKDGKEEFERDSYKIEFKGPRLADTGVRLQVTGAVGGLLSISTIQHGASGAEICTAAISSSCSEGVGASGKGQFADTNIQLALGPAGTVYVSDRQRVGEDEFAPRLQEFDASGAYVDSQILSVKSLRSFAVDSSGNLYIGGNGISKIDPSGKLLATFGEGFSTWHLSIDGSDNVFAVQDEPGVGGQVGDIVTEFDPSGNILQRFGYGAVPRITGIGAFHSASGEVFATDEFRGAEGSQAQVHYLSFPAPGPIVVPAFVKASTVRSTRATLNALVSPDGKEAKYRFDYVDDAEFKANGFNGAGVKHSPEGVVGEDFRMHAISYEAKNLVPATTYHFRVVTTNVDGANAIIGEEFKTLPPIEMGKSWSTEVGVDAATLHGEVNPLGSAASGYFEYVDAATYSESGFAEAKQAPDVEGGSAPLDFGSGESAVINGTSLYPLDPATTYHYRLHGENAFTSAFGPEHTFTTFRAQAPGECGANEAFRTGASALLPDCRAYEMVSPLEKESGDVIALGEFTTRLPATLSESSSSGSKLSYGSYRAFGDAESAPYTTQYVAERGQEGWQSHAITPPHGHSVISIGQTFDSEVKALSPDLCDAWLQTTAEPPLAPGAVPGYRNLYRRHDSGECGEKTYEALNTEAPAHKEPGELFTLELQGLSADGATAIYTANDNYPGTTAPDDQGEKELLYIRDGEEFRYACILPNGEPSRSACSAGTTFHGTGGGQNRVASVDNAISEDGRRLFWTAYEGVSNGGPGQIYMRENPLAEQSSFANGAASGTGSLTAGSNKVTSLVTAAGQASFVLGSATVTLLETSVGHFLPGQPVTAAGKIPSGTTIVSVAGSTLTLSAKATASSASAAITSRGPAPFAVGQAISGTGIPPATTIAAVATGSLTLSANATENKSVIPLIATSKCTEPAKACTLAVSAGGEASSQTHESIFLGAAQDGSKAVFLTGEDLYVFGVASETTKLIAHKVAGIMGASEDLSRIYLASKQALAGANGEGKAPEAGKPNLYLFHEGSFSFIATLAATDANPFVIQGGGVFPISMSPYRRSARITPDGQQAIFTSSATPTGYDNTDAKSGKADIELYRYDATIETLLCVSCNPTGARPVGSGIQERQQGAASWPGSISGWENTLYAPRNLSDDGNRVFFQSSDALSARDTNGVDDVYEWEQAGSGSCEESSPSYSVQDGGCIELISSGQGARLSEFLDASPSGEDVFFATLSSLLPQDYGLVDVYDARVDGGYPAPPARVAECEGEACQGSLEAPNDPTPASATFEGAGNVREEPQAAVRKPCGKGKVRRQGKCVAKKHKHAHKRASRSRRAGR